MTACSSSAPESLNPFLCESLIRAALAEDLGQGGDITSRSIIPAGKTAKAIIRARTEGVLAGIDIAANAFTLYDSSLEVTFRQKDGVRIGKDADLLTVTGSAQSILAAERTALNFLSHLSGIASQTRKMVDLVAHTKARICCTRKTTPGLRAVEKYAVRMGGGVNHRFRLDDAILIKDNHIALAGGDIRAAVLSALAAKSHMIKIEVEVDTIGQLQQILDLPVCAVLLDNMTPADLKRCVELIDGRFVAEACGGVNENNIREIAESGVDLISIGALTHSAPALDIGLDMD